jgi:hypothetical protein
MSKREAILSHRPRVPLEAPPPWDGLFVRPLSVRQQTELEAWRAAQEPGKEDYVGFVLQAIVATVVDAEGNPVFAAEDMDALRDQGDKAMQKISEQVLRVSGLTDNALKDAAKN